MIRWLKRWAWGGTLAPEFDLLDADPALDDAGFLQSFSEDTQRRVSAFDAELDVLRKRRTAEESNARSGPKNAASDEEMRTLAKGMLPTLDGLDRILEFGEAQASSDPAFQNWLTSVKALRTRLLRTLESIGLQALSSIGMEVDLELHDVVSIAPRGKHPPNTVVSEQQRGYMFRGRLLRDAKVVVAQ
jgi:molecular chaperone GrpE